MVEENNISKIVREDILRILGEKDEKVSLKYIEEKIKVSQDFLFSAIDVLREKGLINVEGRFIKLTANGQDKAKNIVKKHIIIENYFKKNKDKEEAHEIAHILEHYISEEVLKNIKKLSTFKKRGISLTKCKLLKEVMVVDVDISGNGLFERIVSMGIFPGEKVLLTNKIPGSIIMGLGNKKLAVARNIAKNIKVFDHDL